ncbi:MAG: metallophosphoesterase [Phycisphaerales bacterium]|nr:metallophosphoesterase [Phycisphaerales bacterium]
MEISRRALLASGSLAVLPGLAGGRGVAGSLAGLSALGGDGSGAALRFGAITDIHYADIDARGTRFYRDSLAKVRAAIEGMNRAHDERALAFAVHLGDLIDTNAETLDDAAVEQELGHLRTMEAELDRLAMERHYVFGNHCLYTLTREEFAAHSRAQRSHYSFDRRFTEGSGSLHVVVLDACYTSDGTGYGRRNFDWTDTNLPEHELRWLEADLAAARDPVIVLTHQRLDGEGQTTIRNAPAARAILEKSGRVLAVLQGHSHENSLATIGGIPYVVLRATVEGAGLEHEAHALVEVLPDLSIAVRGFGMQSARELTRGAG